MFATIFAILILVLAGWAIAKNYDAKVVLFAAGFLLMYAALIMGSDVLAGKDASGLAWADPFKAVKDLFIKQYANAGLIILTLFGFAAYMSKIGANDKVIELLSRPLAAVKSPYILVPLVFWLGTLLSIIIPSAASLAVILMATLYPVLKAAKMTPPPRPASLPQRPPSCRRLWAETMWSQPVCSALIMWSTMSFTITL